MFCQRPAALKLTAGRLGSWKNMASGSVSEVCEMSENHWDLSS